MLLGTLNLTAPSGAILEPAKKPCSSVRGRRVEDCSSSGMLSWSPTVVKDSIVGSGDCSGPLFSVMVGEMAE